MYGEVQRPNQQTGPELPSTGTIGNNKPSGTYSPGPLDVDQSLPYANLEAWGSNELENQIVERDPRELKDHPLGLSVFRDSFDPPFYRSIREHGIVTPLIVCQSKNPELHDRIISGRRRSLVALILGFRKVPCQYYYSDDPREVELLLLLSNLRAG